MVLDVGGVRAVAAREGRRRAGRAPRQLRRRLARRVLPGAGAAARRPRGSRARRAARRRTSTRAEMTPARRHRATSRRTAGRATCCCDAIDAAVVDEARPARERSRRSTCTIRATASASRPAWSTYDAGVRRALPRRADRARRAHRRGRARAARAHCGGVTGGRGAGLRRSTARGAPAPSCAAGVRAGHGRAPHDGEPGVRRSGVDADPQGATRDYGSLLSERPDLMNYAALGLRAHVHAARVALDVVGRSRRTRTSSRTSRASTSRRCSCTPGATARSTSAATSPRSCEAMRIARQARS